jgi:hypothetical protein
MRAVANILISSFSEGLRFYARLVAALVISPVAETLRVSRAFLAQSR